MIDGLTERSWLIRTLRKRKLASLPSDQLRAVQAELQQIYVECELALWLRAELFRGLQGDTGLRLA